MPTSTLLIDFEGGMVYREENYSLDFDVEYVGPSLPSFRENDRMSRSLKAFPSITESFSILSSEKLFFAM